MRTLPLILLLAALAGCKSTQTVQGGSARHDSGGFTFTYDAPGGGKATIRDDRDQVATTQASVVITGDKTKYTSSPVEAGGIPGFSFSAENVTKSPTAWGLIGLLLLAGVGLYFARNWIGVGLCVAGIVLAFVAPFVLVWIAIAAVGLLVYSHRAAFAQVIKGNQAALDALPPAQAVMAKGEMEKAQDQNVKTMVAAVKSTLSEPVTAKGK